MKNLSIRPNNTVRIDSELLDKDSVIVIGGVGNSVLIRENVSGFINLQVLGSNSIVEIQDDVKILGKLNVRIQRGKSKIMIGSLTTFQGACSLYCHEPSSIEVGSDCMFSGGVLVTSSDMHPIYDFNGARINQSEPVFIGDHVWIGYGSNILKGARIGDGSIIGAASLVTTGEYHSNAVYAGNPAVKIKNDVRWARTFNEVY